MKKIERSIFDGVGHVDAICVTTNGVVSRSGAAVMGAGIALGAKTRWPWMPWKLGFDIDVHGVRTVIIGDADAAGVTKVVALPTKYHWSEPSNEGLILRSLTQLVALADDLGWAEVWLPPPGAGNGQIDLSRSLALCDIVLDDRFAVAAPARVWARTREDWDLAMRKRNA